MPFLGQDWRSPGESWVKTEEGWIRTTADETNNNNNNNNNYNNNVSVDSFCEEKGEKEEECFMKEKLLLSPDDDMAAKKRKKDQSNLDSRVPYFHREKWISVHKGSTKERHGYCTLGEAFNRLDFCSAIKETRRFSYVVRLLELIAKSKLPSLSGVAQKNYMNILEGVVQRVLQEQQNVRPIRELLQALYASVCAQVQDVGRSVLVGNVGTWLQRMERILQWQQQLDHIQIRPPASSGMCLTALPDSLHLLIMRRLSDGRDLVSLGQVSPELGVLAQDRLLWKRLCHYHFTERQIRRRLLVSDQGLLDWKQMYSWLSRCAPHREEYSDTLLLCSHCHVLFWKDSSHPCSANNPESCTESLSPQDFIDLFNF